MIGQPNVPLLCLRIVIRIWHEGQDFPSDESEVQDKRLGIEFTTLQDATLQLAYPPTIMIIVIKGQPIHHIVMTEFEAGKAAQDFNFPGVAVKAATPADSSIQPFTRNPSTEEQLDRLVGNPTISQDLAGQPNDAFHDNVPVTRLDDTVDNVVEASAL